MPLHGLSAPRRGAPSGLDDVPAQRRQGDPGCTEDLPLVRTWPAALLPCGTGLFYINEQMLPGIMDIQSATYDDPETVPARVHIQVAERIRWMKRAHELPEFDRFPPGA